MSGCSSINQIEGNHTDTANNAARQHDFLTDILAKVQSKTETDDKTDLVLESTKRVLQSAVENTQTDVEEHINEQSFNPSELVYDDVWIRLPTLYQLSHIKNNRIKSQEKWFIKHKKNIETISKRAEPFLYFITEEVNKRNMPGEIALLPIIESSFKTNAYSHMKASGLWQFVPATGRSFGLKQNWWYDGRRDVYRSTLAALTYLEQLNKYYKGDWLLALAAYNAGAGNINKAIRKNLKKGKPIDYWSLSLPKETYKYIPKLLAISRVIQHHHQYAINLTPIDNQPQLMLVDTHSQIDLSVAAKMADISITDIHSYNPAFKQWATDPDGPHHLLIPIDKVDRFKTQMASLDEKDRVQWYRHKIRSGESLSVIARHYKISVAVIKQANHLKNSRIRAGKYLMVPLSSKPESLASTKSRGSSNNRKSVKKPKNAVTYTVRKGDSFWKIARLFKISHKKLASLNGLSSGDTLSIGQTLIISYNSPKNSSQSVLINNKKTKEISYQVKSGDSLYTISKQFKVTINDLKRWNRLNIKKYLMPGQQLKVFIVDSQSS
ncbi:MAG: LysM peptidoglycan-binding domain-containing protein [gamma proteobacterium symbiont of Bathyaustriella thionipta]|nr:LysM peptidoglycan-binding domain-containing protein [gamma proteobacterium symbiont of Bathyaustriella thionipta]MCU7951601.1 LysM peptidoglycan-binding domain-containing protein [gamma proteobacterium symbiont of Bathyaustriella thionipta]MCU7958203.1 LysM peptidoglycan-binding domain-containing protein [gamma proteobacterium symbiont of Bathyaustriella thionipta]